MKQQGFTLIELIIVIVILGILAVTAAPRFIDLQSDAREASLDGVAAALQGGAQLVYAKAAIAGQQNQTDQGVNLDNDDAAEVTADFGYPDAEGGLAELSEWVDINAVVAGDEATTESDFRFTAIGTTGFAITPRGTAYDGATEANQCQVVYTTPTVRGQSPVISVQAVGC